MIRLTDLTRRYDGGTTVGPVDLEIPEGGVTALVGPNGAGKSTLLMMMGRLMRPDAGTVTVGGHDVFSTPSREIATVLSVLRQENHFVTRLTVRQLVGFGRFPHSRGRLTAADTVAVDDALEFLDLTELQDRHLDRLSGGQRQRAYVAMVLAQDTRYVLLDEPLNNLDMRHSVQMMRRLRAAADDLGRTVVLVVHDINVAARFADHVCAMDAGRVVAFGTPAEIMTPETLTRVFHTPVDVIDTPGGPLASYY
ncbi:ATP-binding cassette domain-containing protein [Corynebacterium bovis]|uniref:iron ABC transporter ATP-binding protein n=1 Tax=Corynebacterium bovis TaxID=36808 RepID=UPI00244BD4A1|nr:ATP-binding cassette domain-containing protein [Corynebacterium bovis]MDH2456167.1 ATP-binding cassette domain-containing protein [Corynebacterium bovis]